MIGGMYGTTAVLGTSPGSTFISLNKINKMGIRMLSKNKRCNLIKFLKQRMNC